MDSFLLATVIGTLAWNTLLITVGYLLRGSSLDPVAAGIVVGPPMIDLEPLVVFLVAFTRGRFAKRQFS
ncbi:hypothetical protein ACQZ6F_31910 [Rhizobium sp. A22-96]